MNLQFKLDLIKLGNGSQANAAQMLEIREPDLSAIVRGRRGPTAAEREKLRKYFSLWKMRRLFPKPPRVAETRIEGARAVGE